MQAYAMTFQVQALDLCAGDGSEDMVLGATTLTRARRFNSVN